ncbi:MAG: hypothetical protein NTZ59_11760, partial [Bacteroidetes bacterium]|nr:hypothetical protein [Bacteroidota bacterium]
MAKSALNKNKPAVNNAATKKADINNGKAGDTKTPPAKVKHIVTEEDLTNNPDLVTQGVKVGDE